MDYGQTPPEPHNAPPAHDPLTAGDNLHLSAPPPPNWHNDTALHHHQQSLYYSPNPTDPNSNYYHYQYNSIRTSPEVQELTPHSGGYADQPLAAASCAAASADPSYPYTGEGLYTVVVGGAIDGVYGYGGEDPRTIAAKAIQQYGAHPLGYAENPVKAANSIKVKKKKLKKTPKVVQAAYCEVCRVDCNSQNVLNSHNDGKKHKKKLKQLQDCITRQAAKEAQASKPVGTGYTTADENENPAVPAVPAVPADLADPTVLAVSAVPAVPAVRGTEVDIETKRSRMIEAGAYSDEVRVCTICNVVVNSQKVFEYHLEGLKHAAMVKKLQEAEFSW